MQLKPEDTFASYPKIYSFFKEMSIHQAYVLPDFVTRIFKFSLQND